MAYSADELILKEGTIQYGTWADPHAITASSNPADSFTATDNLGYIRMGTIVIGLNDTYVEYLSGTPHKIIRKDLLERRYTWQFTCNQFNANAMSIIYKFDVDSGTYVLGWIGNDIPTQTRRGYLLTGERVDGTAVYAGLWEGDCVSEDLSQNRSGTDYVDMPVIIQAFEGSTFTGGNADDTHNYGMYFFPASS